MEEPYDPEYPKGEKFLARFGPRNIIHSVATDVDDPTEDPRWGRVGKQKITDAGPLPPHPGMDPAAKVSMEDIDADLVKRSCDFIDRSVKAGKPFFLWHNSTRCHSFTHLSKKWDGKTGFGLFADAMAELDWVVGELLAKLDELGIADNTIVMFTSDNGAEIFSWPDGGNHPFRGEKGTVYEGGFRVPMLARWPGVIKPGTIINDVMSAEDWMPTLVAAAGEPDLKEKLLTGYQAGGEDLQEPSRRLQLQAVLRGQGQPKVRAASSSISATTPTSWQCVTTSGRSPSRPSSATCSAARRIRPTSRS